MPSQGVPQQGVPQQAEPTGADLTHEVALLFATHRSTPIAELADGSALLSGPDGLVIFDADALWSRPVREPELATAGQVHALPDGHLLLIDIDAPLFATVLRTRCVLASRHRTAAPVDERRRVDLPPGLPRAGLTTLVTGHHLVLTGLTRDRTRRYAARVARLTGDGRPDWLRERPARWVDSDGELLAMTDHHLLVREGGDALDDDGAGGSVLVLFDVDGRRLAEASGEHWWVTDGTESVVVVLAESARDTLVVAGGDGLRRLSLDGRVGGLGGSGDTVRAALFDGLDEQVVEVGPAGTRRLELPPGKKTIGRRCPLVLVRSVLDGPRLIRVEDMKPTARLPVTDHAQGRPVLRRAWARGPHGPSLIELRPDGGLRGTVIHFHGGPESYEVDEPRMFGLARSALADGWQWLGLNYRGSLAPDEEWTTAAWHRWWACLQQDFDWAMGAARSGRVVVAGWSFGASAALALAARRVEVSAAVLGAVMADLRSQAILAGRAGPAQLEWFRRRFDVDGADGDFFAASRAVRPSLRVLSFHGRDDRQCRYELAARLRRCWRDGGADWRHLDLPGRGHHAERVEDAILIRTAAAEFLEAL